MAGAPAAGLQGREADGAAASAVKAAQAGLDYLPRSMIYNPLNAWGKQRELPSAPKQSFREWYLANR